MTESDCTVWSEDRAVGSVSVSTVSHGTALQSACTAGVPVILPLQRKCEVAPVQDMKACAGSEGRAALILNLGT